MDRAGSDDDEQSVVFTVDDLGGGGSSLLDGLVGFGRGRDIVTQERGGDQRVVLRGDDMDRSANWTIVVKGTSFGSNGGGRGAHPGDPGVIHSGGNLVVDCDGHVVFLVCDYIHFAVLL